MRVEERQQAQRQVQAAQREVDEMRQRLRTVEDATVAARGEEATLSEQILLLRRQLR